MKNYKITVSYDGTRYKGWQVLKSTDATIQGKLQMVLSALAGHPVEVIGSGRTDAGVHAIGQVANFHLDEHFSAEEIFEDLNRHLPEDIAARADKHIFACLQIRKRQHRSCSACQGLHSDVFFGYSSAVPFCRNRPSIRLAKLVCP